MATRKASPATTKSGTTPKNTTKKAPANQMTTEETSNDKALQIFIHGFPVINSATVKASTIQRAYNIRFLKNVQSVADIFDSISENGISDPIYLTPDNVALDGYRRLFCAQKIQQEKGIDLDVPVVYINIPDTDIPVFQARCGSSKHINDAEIKGGILEYAKRNPGISNRQIAKVFGVSPTTVDTVLITLRAAPQISEQVVLGSIPQQAAKKILEVAKKIGIEPDKLWVDLVKEIPGEKISEDSDNLKYGGRAISKALKNKYPDIKIETTSKTESSGIPVQPSSKKLLKELWLQLKVSEGGSNNAVYLSGEIDLKLFQQLELLLTSVEADSSAKSSQVTKVKYEGKQNAFEVWNTYKNDDGFVILQSKEGIETFESDAISIASKINTQTSLNPALSIEHLQLSANNLKRITNYCNENEIPLLLVEYTLIEVINGAEISPLTNEDVLISLDDDGVEDNNQTAVENSNDTQLIIADSIPVFELPEKSEISPEEQLADLFAKQDITADIPDELLEPSIEDDEE
jgi:Winged helix-turn-helix DNA-binding